MTYRREKLKRKRGQRGPDKGTGWIKTTILGIVTAEQVKSDWAALTPVERIKTLSSWVPKEVKVDQDTTIRLVINGLQVRAPIDGTPLKAIEAAVLDDASDDPEEITDP